MYEISFGSIKSEGNNSGSRYTYVLPIRMNKEKHPAAVWHPRTFSSKTTFTKAESNIFLCYFEAPKNGKKPAIPFCFLESRSSVTSFTVREIFISVSQTFGSFSSAVCGFCWVRVLLKACFYV